jgi:hypothetical protein
MDMGDGIKYEFAYDQPNIKWSVKAASLEHLRSERIEMRHGSVVGRGRDLLDALEGKKDLHTVLGDTPAIYVKSNYGRSIRLLSSSYHKKTLSDLGITPQTIFGCAFDYLLQLNQESLALVGHDFAILRDPGLLSIGVQIREGDQVMKDPLEPSGYQITLDDTRMRFVDCADTIENHLAIISQGTRQIIWYLISDSIETRKKVKGLLGDKILVNLRDEIIHSRQYALKRSGLKGTDETEQEVLGALRWAAAENWLFALTDYQVFSGWSGYARIAAARSMRARSAFQLQGYTKNGEFRIRDKNCSLACSDDLVEILSRSGAGI